MKIGLLETRLTESFARWDYLYKHGGQDPFHTDGANLWLVRNHILGYKSQIEETCALDEYPAIYHRETPPEMPWDYMARPDKIRENAKKSLALYLDSGDYQYLLGVVDVINPQHAKQSCIHNVIGYARGLTLSIEKDDLVGMRRHKNPAGCLKYLAECAGMVRALRNTPTEGQLSIFDCL